MANNIERPVSADSGVTLPIYQEQLQVGIKTVETGGGVRVHKSVKEQPYTIDEALLHDDVVVKRVPVDQIVAGTEAPATRYEGDTLIVPVFEEIVVIEKRLRIKEEIHITKKKREERYVETVFLKAEEVSVDHFDGASEAQRK